MLYRHYMKIQADTSADGTLDPVYADWMVNIPCAITPKSGGEVYRGQQLQAETTNVIECRYIKGIMPNMVIINQITGQEYLIRRCIDDKGRQREWIIEATEVVV